MSEAIETPSGKGAADENFPVGSWLLPARLRPHVALFYRFARAIDDIADNPALAPQDKIARLSRFAAALQGRSDDDPALATAVRMRQSLAETEEATGALPRPPAAASLSAMPPWSAPVASPLSRAS